MAACDPAGGMEPVCGFSGPEDIARDPLTGALLVSEFGARDGSKPGRLVSWRPGDEMPRPLWPPGPADSRSGLAFESDLPPSPLWGAADCPGPPGALFSPHGLDVDRRDDRWQLLVVNHGGRESIEYFELRASEGEPLLVWRGCVVTPDGTSLDDVVALSSGGFWATHIHPRDAAFASLLKALLGTDVGHVLEWTPRRGFATVPGTDARMPNGIERSADETELFVAAYLGGEVLRIDAGSGELLARVRVEAPDNLTWGEDGRLLVASRDVDLAALRSCQHLQAGACGPGFRLLALDPSSLAPELLLEHEGAPMAGVTVARQVDGSYWLGSAAGDRIARFTPGP